MKKSIFSRVAALAIVAGSLVAATSPANAGVMTLGISVDGAAAVYAPQTLFGPPIDKAGVDIVIEVAPSVRLLVNSAIANNPGDPSSANLQITVSVSGKLAGSHTVDIVTMDSGFLLPTTAPLLMSGTVSTSTTTSVITDYDSYVFDPTTGFGPPFLGGAFALSPVGYPDPAFVAPFASALDASGDINGNIPAITFLPLSITSPYTIMSIASLTLGTGTDGTNIVLTTSITPFASVPEPSSVVLWSLIATVMGVSAYRRKS